MGNRLQEIEFKPSNEGRKKKKCEFQEFVSLDGNLVAIKWMDNQHVYTHPYVEDLVQNKKWTLKVILHFLDFVVVNSWLQYRGDCHKRKMPRKKINNLLKFRLDLSKALISCPSNEKEVVVQPEEEPFPKHQNWRTAVPATDKRHDRLNHWPVNDYLKTA
ncbi:hypothetical protein J6590_075466 [Homalodisca vitripennis]|nr:hypothetical protein J6590_075466 [Homalodisca vitripennis]